MNTFLVAIDSSSAQEQVLQKVITLAMPEHTRIILMTVVEPITSYLPPILMPTGDWVTLPLSIDSETENKLMESAGLLLKKAAQRCQEKGLTCEVRLESGSPREAICHVAQQVSPDLLIVGSRGLGSVERLMLGSVSDYVIHHAACAVLVVR